MKNTFDSQARLLLAVAAAGTGIAIMIGCDAVTGAVGVVPSEWLCRERVFCHPRRFACHLMAMPVGQRFISHSA